LDFQVTDPDLSIVLPVYDEAENLDPLWVELRNSLEVLGLRFEALFVDDGSGDGSGEALDRMALDDDRVRVLHLESHSGQTAALDAGFRSARGNIVITMDSDLQNDPADIPLLLEMIGPFDAAVGRRVVRRDPWPRGLASRIANAVRNYVSDEFISDTGCSLKAFRRECLNRIRLYDGMHRFLPTLLKMEGFTVTEVVVGHRERHRGSSKYTLGSRFLRSCWDLVTVRWMQKRRLTYRLTGKVRRVEGRGRSSRTE
jgi:dolichol-phosphate mannosyltransferase